MKKGICAALLAAALVCATIVPVSAYDMGKVGEYNRIGCGFGHTAIDVNGSLWEWNNYPYKSDEDPTKVFEAPVKMLDNVVTVSCEAGNTAAVKSDGTLWTWGFNFYAQLGNGTRERSTVPTKVLDNVAAISLGSGHTAAIKTDGTLWMWGRNNLGQLGNGGAGNEKDKYGDSYQTVPVKVLDNVVAVSCGSLSTAAIKTDGTLWMWGNNNRGQLGNGGAGNEKSWEGGTPYQTVPVKVLDNVTAVSCGNNYTAVIKADGTLWMWGENNSGQLGNSGKANGKDRYGTLYQTVPVKVLDNVATVNFGGSYTAAIKTDGTLWTWGSNGLGQLGNGTRNPSAVPIKVLDNVAAVSCSSASTIAVKTDGTLWAWGGGETKRVALNPQEITLTMPKGVRLYLNGGMGGSALWTDSTGTIKVPTNPTKEGYTFGGWYTDAALTTPWNFNNKVVNTLTLYAKWIPVSSTATKTGKNQSTISLNGKNVTLDAYTLKAANGGDVTYVKLRDIAALLESTSAKFNVDWKRGAIYVASKTAYTTKNGSELKAISGTDGSYKWNQAPVLFDGTTKALEGIVLTDGQGGGHTFFKLRDLGDAIGFTVDWTAERGIFIETK